MRRSASSSFVISTACLFVLLLTGCGPQAGPPAPTPASPSDSAISAPATETVTATATATATETAAGTPDATGTSAPSAAWKTYTTADGQLAFDLPSAWSVKDPAGELAEGGGAFAEITNQAGKPLATLRTNMATGSTCTERYPYSVLESQELAALTQNGVTPRFVFETRGDATGPGPANTPAAAYGITSVPAPTGNSACPIFHFFTWPPNAAMFGAFYSPANNETPGDASLPYLEKAKMYADTPEYQDIKRMITSLRPTG
ncbi:hypothetical protein [Arthrobacter sp. ZGTC131]|uniref:hypothetical protein n=1 Tax=Arthrobacter sp. ZGTC131 TaxID=2058898 RepID=UPI000CE4F696|nr:hypothetical protein [Arthrobacter sp. ZGTC131]